MLWPAELAEAAPNIFMERVAQGGLVELSH